MSSFLESLLQPRVRHVLLEDGGEGSLQTPKMRESSEAGETESQKRRRRGEEERGWGEGWRGG